MFEAGRIAKRVAQTGPYAGDARAEARGVTAASSGHYIIGRGRGQQQQSEVPIEVPREGR